MLVVIIMDLLSISSLIKWDFLELEMESCADRTDECR